MKDIHSYWAFLVVFTVALGAVNAIAGVLTKKDFGNKDFKVNLFALIATHTQFMFGAILFFMSDKVLWFRDNVDVGLIMKTSSLRLYNVEHPFLMIVAAILVTIGYSKHKKKLISAPKFKTIAIFYSLALIAMLLMIPWKAWLF